MKKLWIVCILLVLIIAVVCCLWIFRSRSGSDTDVGALIPKPKSFAHLPLTQLRQSGAVMTGRLESPMVLDGYPCDANWVHFTEAGKLKAFFLSDTCMVQGNKIPKGTWIQLYPDQTVQFCSFPEDTVIQGQVCRGGSGGAKGVSTSFYPNGSLKEFTLSRDTEIGGRTLSAGQHVVLDEQGNVKSVVPPPFYERPLDWITRFVPGG